MDKQFKVFHTIQLNRLPRVFYDTAVGLYLLHFAVMADLTNLYPDTLLRFRIGSFALVTLLVAVAICSRFLRKQIPVKMLVFFLAFFAAILLSAAHSENLPYIKDYFGGGYFIKHVLLFALLFVYEEDPDTRVRQLTVIAVATLMVYQLALPTDIFMTEEGLFKYMAFGYGCAPWWVIVAQGIFYYKKWWAKMFCLITAGYYGAMIVNYGNRGALAVIVIATGIMLLAYVPLKRLVFLGTACATALLGLIAFLQPVISFLAEKLDFDLSKSRNFRLLSTNMMGAYSGRLPIYQEVLDGILHHPLLGIGIGGDKVITSEHCYAHNIVLELCVDFGVIIGVLIYCWLVYIGIRALFYWRDRDWKALFLPFYVFSMVMLFFSETIYKSGYLMASVMIYLTYTTYFSRCQRKQLYAGGAQAADAVRLGQ